MNSRKKWRTLDRFWDLHFRRQYLTDRLTMTHTHSLLLENIQTIEAQWRFPYCVKDSNSSQHSKNSYLNYLHITFPNFHFSTSLKKSLFTNSQIVLPRLTKLSSRNSDNKNSRIKLSSSPMGQKFTSVWGLRSGSLLFYCHSFFPSPLSLQYFIRYRQPFSKWFNWQKKAISIDHS